MPHASQVLSFDEHSRNSAGLSYVYPVISRRTGGVSIGINLNPNHACNWRCVYCQVPSPRRGAAPPIHIGLLAQELRGFLRQVLDGDFMIRRVPPEARWLSDIALSGNGEPTLSPNFDEVLKCVGQIMDEFRLNERIKLILLTNGSLLSRLRVRQGLMQMAPRNGEIWFKVDSASRMGMYRINGIRQVVKRMTHNIALAARTCPTWLQTCLFAWDGQPPPPAETQAYLKLLRNLQADCVPLRGVHLYGPSRPVQRPEAVHVSRLPAVWMRDFALRIEALGIPVKLVT
ncbi:MAG: radical SAM protein [Pseudomonadota bacterium]